MKPEDSILSGLDPAGLFDLGSAGTDPGASSFWEPPTPAYLATLFPKWEILRLLGRGGMGAVYHARQPDLDRNIAIKLLPIETSADEAFVQRFQREARTLAKLRHPNIVALHEFGTTPAGHPFFAMEYVDGTTLAEKIGTLTVPEALEIIRQACDALTHAHSLGIVHRDIKPSNILIDTTGHIKIADFGLAKWDQPQGPAMTLSRTGNFMGTAEYAAPEQVKDAAHADHRADIYSLGVLFYEMLTGERPRGIFRPPSAKSGSDPRLDPVVLRALHENPGERYQAASDLREEIARLHRRTHLLPWLTGALALLLIAALAVLLLRKDPPPVQTTAPAPISPPAEFPAPEPIKPQPAPIPPEPAEPVVTEEKKPAPVPAPTPTPEPPPAPVVRPKVFSLTNVDPKFYPPAPYLDRPWKSFALTATGGAILTTDQKLLLWDAEEPAREIEAHEPIAQLASTPSHIITLSETGSVHVLTKGGPTLLIGPTALLLGNSSEEKTIPAVVSPPTFDRKLRLNHFRVPPTMLTHGPEIPPNIISLSMSANGITYLLGKDGELYRNKEENTEAIRKNIAAIAAGKDHLAILAKDGTVEILDGPPPPSDLGKVLHITAGDGFTLAVQPDGRGVLFFTDPTRKPLRYRLASGTAPVTASPSGLFISR